MYDRPETAAAHDRFWACIRARLIDQNIAAPRQLTRTMDPWDLWQSPDLLIAQTCGLPYRTRLHHRVTLVGTPIYDLNCPPGQYYSVLVIHKSTKPSTLTNTKLAYNEALSQSGWAAPKDWARKSGVEFTSLLRTGAHLKSAEAVADGRADIAAIDALTWSMIQRWDSFANDLIEVAQTDPTPTLPYITAKTRDPKPLFQALTQATADLAPQDRDTLGLRGFTQIPSKQYLAVPIPTPPQE